MKKGSNPPPPAGIQKPPPPPTPPRAGSADFAEYTRNQQSLINAIIAVTHQLRVHDHAGAASPMEDLRRALEWTRSRLKDNTHAHRVADWIEQQVTYTPLLAEPTAVDCRPYQPYCVACGNNMQKCSEIRRRKAPEATT